MKREGICKKHPVYDSRDIFKKVSYLILKKITMKSVRDKSQLKFHRKTQQNFYTHSPRAYR